MLEIDSVTFSYGNRSILSGCYINCKPGEIVGLLGRNGSGKSTLLKIIFGSLKADFMHLRINNIIVTSGFSKRDIAYLPQENFLPPFYKVCGLINEISHKLLTDETRDYLSKISETKYKDLSGGEQKFLECLWVLSQPATYALLDEPFSGISPLQIELLQQAIRISAQEKGIVLTDHLYTPLIAISNRVILLHNKAVYKIEDEEDLIRYNYLPSVY
jgi:lipopolysaccharide export system ATP-binding protein